MNRKKKLCVLSGVLAAACAVTFGVSSYEKQKEIIKNSDEIILTLDSEKVQALSWKNETDQLSFHKDETWIYDEDEAFPVDEEKINELLEPFLEFGVSFVIEEAEDLGQYGLDDPVCTIQIKTEETDYEILLGDYSKMDSERYVSIGDGKVYLVKDDPLNYYDAGLKDMIKHDELPEFEQVTQVEFAGAENYQVVYEENSANTYCKEDVYFTEREGTMVPLDTLRVKDYLQTMSWLDLTDYVTYQASAEDLGAYGLDEPELSVTVQHLYEDENQQEAEGTAVLHIGLDAETKKKLENASEDEEMDEEVTAYARVGDSEIIYQITGDSYETLMKASYNELRHQEIVTADWNDINQIDISLEGVDYTISAEGKDDKKTWYYKEEEVETAGLSESLEALKSSEFTEEAPSRKEEISLTLHLDNENFPTVEIGFFRYDGASCIAQIDGKTVSLADRAQVVGLIEAVNGIVLN